jgi:hypothetical protein
MKKILITFLALFVANISLAETRLDQMVAPGFHPVTFEDPRNTTELRPVFVHHNIDDDFVTGGGDVQIYALQARYAINDDWSIIATKDGYVDFNPKAGVPKDNGWANVEAGLKYAFYQDAQAGNIASVQLRYEFPWGDEEVLQGNGDGIVHPSLSAAFALDSNFTLMAGSGMRIAVDGDDSTLLDLDAQLDYRIDMDGWSLHPLIGTSVIHVFDGGRRLPIADEGQDFFNFGASESDGENMVIGAAGLRAKFCNGVETGFAYQFPYNSQKGNRIIDDRWTADVIFRF